MTTAQIGSISEGTQRPEDLIDAFMDELRELDPERAEEIQEDVDKLELIEEPKYEAYYNDEDDIDGMSSAELASHILNDDLFDALDELAPPYCYFGSHEGDGASYGFWPAVDYVEQEIRDDEICSLDDREPTQEELEEYDFFVRVNDHGNMTLYSKEYALKEEWAIV